MDKELNNKKVAWYDKGRLKLIVGSMYSGKTSRLIEEYDNLKEIRPCLMFKPSADNRYSQTEVVSHNGEKAEAIPFKELGEISVVLEKEVKHRGKKSKVRDIFIDELQFLPEHAYRYFEEWVKEDIHITVAGLSWDYFKDQPFLNTVNVLAIANSVEITTATCEYFPPDMKEEEKIGLGWDEPYCRQPAVRSIWKLDKLPEKPEDYVGGKEKYISVCLEHYVPIKNKLHDRKCGTKTDCPKCGEKDKHLECCDECKKAFCLDCIRLYYGSERLWCEDCFNKQPEEKKKIMLQPRGNPIEGMFKEMDERVKRVGEKGECYFLCGRILKEQRKMLVGKATHIKSCLECVNELVKKEVEKDALIDCPPFYWEVDMTESNWEEKLNEWIVELMTRDLETDDLIAEIERRKNK